uniref:Uncharacterized protein n=1 Tax=Anguilla anguilla TaxID=7936 RepID=A0A0E9VVK2_ANGAN
MWPKLSEHLFLFNLIHLINKMMSYLFQIEIQSVKFSTMNEIKCDWLLPKAVNFRMRTEAAKVNRTEDAVFKSNNVFNE